MTTKLTEAKLRQMVREEFNRSQDGEETRLVMTEARANTVAGEVLEEGLFDTIKAGFAALTAGGSAAASKMGTEAGKAFKPAIDLVGKITKAAADTKKNVTKGIASIKDAAVKKAALAAQKSFQASLSSALKKEIATGVANLSKAGMSEDEAKSLIATIASDACLAVLGQGPTASAAGGALGKKGGAATAAKRGAGTRAGAATK